MRLAGLLVLTLVLTLGLAGLVWLGQRHAVFGWARAGWPPTAAEVTPPAYLAAARARPPRTITFFGASNYARSPVLTPLAEALSACAGAPVTVRAVARAGANSDWGMGQLDAALSGTDILVVGFSGNDASLWRGLPIARSVANHEAIVRAAQARGVMVFLSGGGGSSTGIRGVNRLIRPGLPDYTIRDGAELARRTGVARVPDNPARDALSPAEQRALMPDGLHATPEAVLRFSLPVYLEMLRPLVCPAPD